MLDENYLYLVRFNSECFIASAEELKTTLQKINSEGIFALWDIGQNFYKSDLTEKHTLSFQKLYNIKDIGLGW